MKKETSILKTIVHCLKLTFSCANKKERFIICLGFVTSLLPALVTLLQKEIFKLAEDLPTMDHKLLRIVIFLAIAMVVSSYILTLVGILTQFVFDKLQLIIRKQLMSDIVSKLSRVKLSHMESPEIYEKIKLMSNALELHMQRTVSGIIVIVLSSITVISLIPVIVSESVWIAVIIVITSLPLYYFLKRQNVEEFVTNQYNCKEDNQQYYLYRCYNYEERLREIQMGLFGGYIRTRWKQLSLILNNRRFQLNRQLFFNTIMSNMIRYVGIAISLIIIVEKILSKETNIGSFVVIYSSIIILQDSLAALFTNLSSVSLTSKYLDDYQDILNMPDESVDTDDVDLPASADIIAESLSFAYPGSDRLVLKDINITIKQGDKIAIVGENGSGKSTFISLLCGFYTPTKGSLKFNGKHVDRNPNHVRRSISVVTQDFTKFEMTAEENIAIGKGMQKVQFNEIVSAAQKSHADEVIHTLPQGYETHIGTLEKGTANLSGGQWQKLAFARSLIKKDALCLVLDEQTAALDPIAEVQFYKDFVEVTQDKTVIMVSHRLGAIKLCNRIVVLNNGEIEEEGNHEQLMKNDGLYAMMYRSQAGLYV